MICKLIINLITRFEENSYKITFLDVLHLKSNKVRLRN